MSREHFVLTASNEGGRWVILRRDDAGTSDVFSTAAGSLESRVHFLLETLQARPGAEITFSTRPVAEVQAAGLIEDAAAVRRAAPGVSLCILAPMGGAFAPDLWGTAWRDPWSTLSEGTRDTRFRVMTLLEVTREWFIKQSWDSFRAELPRERVAQFQRISRPGWPRELLVRHDWTIRDVMAEPAAATPAAASA